MEIETGKINDAEYSREYMILRLSDYEIIHIFRAIKDYASRAELSLNERTLVCNMATKINRAMECKPIMVSNVDEYIAKRFRRATNEPNE